MPARAPLVRFAGIGIGAIVGLFFLLRFLQRVGFLPSHDVPPPAPELIRPSHVLKPQILHADPLIHPSFEAYDPAYTNVPAWVIRLSAASSPAPDSASPARRNATAGKQGSSYRSLYRSTIHRFFDSSPFSPSGRYLAVTRLPAPQPSALLRGKVADVFIVDLVAGGETLVARSGAWGAQLGPQLQWGVTDDVLVFNQAVASAASTSSTSTSIGSSGGVGGRNRARSEPPAPPTFSGVVYDLTTQTARHLPCPVYHVSPDGRHSAAPNLLRVRYTQFGYGADYLQPAAARRTRRGGANATSDLPPPAPADGGGSTGSSSSTGNSSHSPLFESSPATHASRRDGLYISDLLTGQCALWVSLFDLCHIAGLDTENTPTYGFHAKWAPDGTKVLFVVRTMERARGLAGWWGQRVRRQHLFVVEVGGAGAGAGAAGRGRRARHVVSWSSRDFAAASGPGPGAGSGSEAGAGSAGSEAGAGATHEADGNHPSWVPGSSLISMNMRVGGRWQLVTYDASDAAGAGATVGSAARAGAGVGATRLFAPSSGHPNMAPGARYALLDVYAKERQLFAPFAAHSSAAPAPSSHAPLRLVDTQTGREAWLLSLPLQPEPLSHSSSHSSATAVTGLPPPLPAREARAWRCDMHPAWSRDHSWVALTGRPSGRGREVVIAYLGGDLARFFDKAAD